MPHRPGFRFLSPGRGVTQSWPRFLDIHLAGLRAAPDAR
jgi:hypothetical protein